jgi:hypothetical protein
MVVLGRRAPMLFEEDGDVALALAAHRPRPGRHADVLDRRRARVDHVTDGRTADRLA